MQSVWVTEAYYEEYYDVNYNILIPNLSDTANIGSKTSFFKKSIFEWNSHTAYVSLKYIFFTLSSRWEKSTHLPVDKL